MMYPTDKLKTDYLLSILPRRGPGAFSIFIKSLVMTRQDHIAMLLEPSMAKCYISERQQNESGGTDMHQPVVPPGESECQITNRLW